MNAYIEIESLRSLIEQRNDERYEECKRMLKKDLCLHFPFSKEEAFDDPLIQEWVLNELISGANFRKPKWDSSYPDSVDYLKQKDMDIEKLCAVYLLDDPEPQPLSNAMFVGHYGHELDTLMGLFVVPEEAEFKYDFSVSSMTSWVVTQPYVTPCTDLLIVDRYILSKASLFERNLYRLIKVFVSKTKSQHINIVVVAEFGSIDYSITLEKISDRIKEFVLDIVGEEPFVTFVLCRKRADDPLFHDRCILTNYRFMDSGDSFNYFAENGKLKTGGFKLSISSLAKPSDYIQRIINDEVLSKIQHEVDHAVSVFGDEKSGFLTF